jgi:hypothetical protein
MPAGEAPSPTLNTLSILLELGMLIGVIGIVPGILRSLPEDAPRGGWIFLLVVAVVSGIGIFGIRMAGGPRVELPPRTSSTSSATEGLPHQLHEQLAALDTLSNKLVATKWLQTVATEDPAKIRTLTRENLQEPRGLSGEMRDCADRILKVFAEATAKGVAHSTLSDDPGAARPETWQTTREVYVATSDYLGLIEQHWDEWVANPFPAEKSDLKPWQVEIQRLIDASWASSREARALLNSKSEAGALNALLSERITSWVNADRKTTATRWQTLKKDPNQARTRTRQDLQEMRGFSLEVQERAERIVKVLEDAKSKRIDVSSAWPAQEMTRLELWRAAQQMYSAGLERLALIEQNWDEWKAQPEAPDEKSMKPWQRELKRLEAVVDAKNSEIQKAPRTAATPTAAPSPPANNFDQLALQTHMLPAVTDYVTALKRLQATRWIKSPDAKSYHPQKITRADLHDPNEKLRDLIAAIDKLRADLDAQTLPVPAAEKEYWRIKRETSLAFQQLTGILEENWKEWHVTGIQPKTSEAKPWQKEALRLQGEVDKLKQIDQTSILL